MSFSIPSAASPRGGGDATPHELQAPLPPPALHPTHQARSASAERHPVLEGISQNQWRRPLLSPCLVCSSASSPTIVPLVDTHGDNAPKWTKRHIHKWKSPFLMMLFFALGVTVSLAHCVFYARLDGRIVGDSSQQEEKLR